MKSHCRRWVKDSRILAQFDLARKPNGKWANKVGRDVLFIQRNLEFLKPGGRMAIVLPQGRLNNVSDSYIRQYVSQHARVLASVSLHINSFKPHANTKTSILFLQKWNDDPKAGPLCPKVDDYPIFFATSQAAGKDNTGDYVYLADDKGKRLYDLHGHPMVDHDLFNLRAYLAGQCEQMMGATTSKAKKDVLQAKYKDKLPFVPDRPGIAEAFQAWAANRASPSARRASNGRVEYRKHQRSASM